MGIRCGVDIVETARIKAAVERLGPRFLNRIFTEAEQAYCASRGENRMSSLAARFAAKEAVSKALGTGIGSGASFLDIEVVQSPGGAPAILLRGDARETFRSIGGVEMAVSLSHERAYAVAQAVMTTCSGKV